MLLEIIRHLMPEYVSPFLISLVDEVYSRSMGIISITAIIAIWSAAKGVQYMTDGLNSVNDLEETRNWFVLRFWRSSIRWFFWWRLFLPCWFWCSETS